MGYEMSIPAYLEFLPAPLRERLWTCAEPVPAVPDLRVAPGLRSEFPHLLTDEALGLVVEVYQATATFWRPELIKQPPDMAALLPMWIASGLIGAFLSAAVYDWLRPALAGAGWQRGLKFGVIAFIFHLVATLGFQGVFNLPAQIWVWWCVEAVAYLLVGGIALGWVTQKLSPDKT